jgi:hypothetical protein
MAGCARFEIAASFTRIQITKGQKDRPKSRGFATVIDFMTMTPNKSPEPTRIGAVSCPQGFQWFHITGSGWLSFFR